MIKVTRVLSRRAQKAIQALETAKKQNGTYNLPEVNAALQEIFHGKCLEAFSVSAPYPARLNIYHTSFDDIADFVENS